jgi:hypothetical protein
MLAMSRRSPPRRALLSRHTHGQLLGRGRTVPSRMTTIFSAMGAAASVFCPVSFNSITYPNPVYRRNSLPVCELPVFAIRIQLGTTFFSSVPLPRANTWSSARPARNTPTPCMIRGMYSSSYRDRSSAHWSLISRFCRVCQ